MKKITILCLAVGLLSSCSQLQTRYHEVERGESLASIAAQHEVSVEDLKEVNPELLEKVLVEGQKLYIPFEKGTSWNNSPLKNKNQKANVELNKGHFSWPVFGYVSSGFGRRHGRDHEGIDIPARKGTPVLSSRSGHVIYAGNKIRGYGNLIVIRHAGEYSTVYAHLSKIEVKKGQFVSRGQRIGKVGNTGRSTSPHLHFEIRENRVAVNPLFFLQGQYAHNIIGR